MYLLLAWCAWPGLATRSEIHETFVYKIIPVSRAIHVVTARPIVGNRNVKIQDGCVLYKDVGIIRLSRDQNHVSGFGWENSRRKATGVQNFALKDSPRSRFAINNNSPKEHQIRSWSWSEVLDMDVNPCPRSALVRWVFSWEQINTVNSYKRPVGCVEGIPGNLISIPNRRPPESGKDSVNSPCDEYQDRENRYHCARMLRVYYELPHGFHFPRILVLWLGIGGLCLGAYGVLLCMGGYGGGDRAMLFRGLCFAFAGWIIGFCGLFLFFEHSPTLSSSGHDPYVLLSVCIPEPAYHASNSLISQT